MLSVLTLALSTVSLPPQGGGPLQISEVLVAPTAGAPIVEITNTGSSSVDTATVQLVVGTTHESLPSTGLASGGFVRVHVGTTGMNTPTDLFTPNLARPSRVAGSIALYRSTAGPVGPAFFQAPTNIDDFLQWGAPFQLYSGVAQQAWVWFFKDTFVPAPAVDESLAWRGQGKQSIDWFRDVSPTLGRPNVQPGANVSFFGSQCTLAAAGPMLLADLPPALGNRDFRIDFWTQSLNQPAILFIGTGTTSIPLFGGQCRFGVQGIFSQISFTTPPTGTLSLPIPVPHRPALLGQRVVFQVAVANGFGLPGGRTVDLSPALVVNV